MVTASKGVAAASDRDDCPLRSGDVRASVVAEAAELDVEMAAAVAGAEEAVSEVLSLLAMVSPFGFGIR